MRQFNHYEFTGILVPGAATLFGIASLYPDIFWAGTLTQISFGGFGMFVILAYILGHLIQAVGNLFESIWWIIWGGLPSDWLRTKPNRILAPNQVQRIQELGHKRLGLEPFEINKLNAREWYAVTRQIFAAVESAGQAERIETFNGNYGLNRGLCAGLLIVVLAGLTTNPVRYDIVTLAALATLIAAIRMHRFGRHYARELFVRFLQLPSSDNGRKNVASNAEK
ncbi:MAG: hypothetical protein ACR2P9_08560 [Gammaproteobacteria bacterium]